MIAFLFDRTSLYFFFGDFQFSRWKTCRFLHNFLYFLQKVFGEESRGVRGKFRNKKLKKNEKFYGKLEKVKWKSWKFAKTRRMKKIKVEEEKKRKS